MLALHLRSGVALAVTLVASCGPRQIPANSAVPPLVKAAPYEYELVIRENYEERRFEVHVNSTTSRTLCIDSDSWPNDLGQVHYASDRVHVTSRGKEFPVRDRNFGYCVPTREYDCYRVLPPGGAVYGFIAFSEFDQEMWDDPRAERHLVFEIGPVACW